jgi:transposase
MHVYGHLTPARLRALAKTHSQRRRIWVRFQAVVLAAQGRTAVDIAQALGVSRRAVQGWVAGYNRGGPDALRERPHTGRPRLLGADQYERLRQRLDAPPRPEDAVCTRRGTDIRRILEQEFGVAISLRAVYDLLDRIGYSSLMPRPQHTDADEQLQAIFKEVVRDHSEAIEEAHPDEEVRVSHHDAARFGQRGTITRVWARRGSRPRAVRQTQYTSLFVLVAVCAATGSVSALIMPELNAAVINLFLKQFSGELPAGVHAVLIWDQAGYHTSSELRLPKNVSLILLPPYSPELNPVENLWHFLRSHHWSSRVYRDYSEREQEAIRSLCAVCRDVERVKSVGAADHLRKSA